MIKLISLSIVMAAIGLTQLATAQDLPQAGKRGNIDYVEVQYIKYKNGMGGAAGRIIREKFMPAAAKAEIPSPITLHMQTGPWNAINFWNYGDSMGNLDYFMTPDNAKFWAALAELNGGIENARKIFADYNATIDTMQRELAHRHLPPAEDN